MAGFQHGAEIFDKINRISEIFDRMTGFSGWTGGGKA
jgi:hypothetical protein